MDWYQISHVHFLFLFLEISKFLLKFRAKYLINIWQPMHSAIMNSITDLFIFSAVMKSIRLNIFLTISQNITIAFEVKMV